MPRYNPDQAPIREGEVEYITVQDGRRREVRRWLPEEEEWSYTRLGRSYYRQRRVQWLVEVPVEVRGRRRDSQGEYAKQAWLPVSFLGMQQMTTAALMHSRDAKAALKRQVLDQAVSHELPDGSQVIYEFSGETFVVDDRREWRISALATTPGPHGAPPTTEAISTPRRRSTSAITSEPRARAPLCSSAEARRKLICSWSSSRKKRRRSWALCAGAKRRGMSGISGHLGGLRVQQRLEGRRGRPLCPLHLRTVSAGPTTSARASMSCGARW